MSTINISVPAELKKRVEELVKTGLYTSFSDACRDGLRKVLQRDDYEDFILTAKRENDAGKQIGLNPEQVDDLFSKLE